MWSLFTTIAFLKKKMPSFLCIRINYKRWKAMKKSIITPYNCLSGSWRNQNTWERHITKHMESHGYVDGHDWLLKLHYSTYKTSRFSHKKRNKRKIVNDKWSNESVPPGLVAGIAPHEASHRFVRSSNLLHVFTKSFELVAISALFACVLIDCFLHWVVEACLILLQLCQFVLSNDFPCLLVEISLFFVFRKL